MRLIHAPVEQSEVTESEVLVNYSEKIYRGERACDQERLRAHLEAEEFSDFAAAEERLAASGLRLALVAHNAETTFIDSIIRDGSDISIHRFTVIHTCPVSKVWENLKRGIFAYLRTDEGREVVEENSGDFNVGDACVSTPDHFFHPFGIFSLEGEDANGRITVDHDENLARALEAEDEE